jgi:hypothetical protein
MKSIVVGFSDASGRSEPKVLCGPDVADAQQAKLFHRAKREQAFPKGVVRMELAFFDEERRHIAIRLGPIASETNKQANHASQ